jgi:hypothetical protein
MRATLKMDTTTRIKPIQPMTTTTGSTMIKVLLQAGMDNRGVL